MQKVLQTFFQKYNFLWVLYILVLVCIQGQLLAEDLVHLPETLPYIIWNIFIAIFSIVSLSAFVFREPHYPQKVWKLMFVIVILNIPVIFFRSLSENIPIGNLQYSCDEVGVFCTFIKFSRAFNTILYLLPVYYALLKLARPAFTLPFVAYPTFTAALNTAPNRLLAIPVIGFLIKVFLLIPFFIVAWLISFVSIVLQIINYFHILFVGRVWILAFRFTMWTVSLYANLTAYLFGITDKYPTFNEKLEDPKLALTFQPQQKSNRLLGAPVLGLFIRYIFISPLQVYTSYLMYAAMLGVVISWFTVLFTGKYPKSVHELASDTIKLQSAYVLYSTAMSDKYPSFAISLEHPIQKALLLFFSILLISIPTIMAAVFNTPS